MSQWVRTFQVQSDSNPNLDYQVGVKADGTYGCSCPNWKFRRNECKHIRRIKSQVERAATVDRALATEVYQVPVGKPFTKDERRIANRLGQKVFKKVNGLAALNAAVIAKLEAKAKVVEPEPNELLDVGAPLDGAKPRRLVILEE